MMDLTEEIIDLKEKMRRLEETRVLIDVKHGYDVTELIDVMVTAGLDESREKPLILYHGEECYYFINKKFKDESVDKASLNGDLYSLIDGEITINKDLICNRDSIIIWSANAISVEVLKLLIEATMNVPIFLIGDTDYTFYDSRMRTMFDRSVYFIDKITNIEEYNLEVVYLNNRIRKHDMPKLSVINHRSYNIDKVDLSAITTVTYISYDAVVTLSEHPWDMNNAIRDMFDYKDIPNVNETMVITHDMLITDMDKETVYIEKYSFLKVVDVIIEARKLFIITEYRGSTIKMLVDTAHLATITDCENVDPSVDTYDGGAKLEYTYVVPPVYLSFKAVDNLLILLSNPLGVSVSSTLYRIIASARKRVTIYTDHLYDLY